MTRMNLAGIKLDYSALSDRGMHRAVNEDAVLALAPMFFVADGMGGHEAGDLASQAALAAFEAGIPAGEASDNSAVGQVLEHARGAVAEVAEGRSRGAGCTLTGAVLTEHDGELTWLVLNIGDSRVYRYANGKLEQITSDHSLASELRAAEPGVTLPPRNIITRALGSMDTTADSWQLPVEAGTRLLMCSDGLTSEVDDAEIAAVLAEGTRAEYAASDLVALANDAGGRDNISVIVVDVVRALQGSPE